MNQELLIDQCRRFLIMIDNPEPTLATWNLAVESIVRQMRENLQQDDKTSIEPTWCGRCYDSVEVFPTNCNEQPELLKGRALGQYHCPDCGAMILAGMPHPPLCRKCLDRQHLGFDVVSFKRKDD